MMEPKEEAPLTRRSHPYYTRSQALASTATQLELHTEDGKLTDPNYSTSKGGASSSHVSRVHHTSKGNQVNILESRRGGGR